MIPLKELPTIWLIDIAKGNWSLVPTINPTAITKEMNEWCEAAKAKMIKDLRDELKRRGSE